MSFLTHTSENVLWMSSSLLDGSDVRHGFSTRIGGVSPAPWDSLNLGVGRGDDMDRVRENYRRFCAALGVDEHRAMLSKQVHEDNVRHVTAEDCGKGLFRDRDYTSVDAMVTDTPDIPLVVFSADCGIILLHDPVHGAVGAAHAGWRGAANMRFFMGYLDFTGRSWRSERPGPGPSAGGTSTAPDGRRCSPGTRRFAAPRPFPATGR